MTKAWLIVSMAAVSMLACMAGCASEGASDADGPEGPTAVAQQELAKGNGIIVIYRNLNLFQCKAREGQTDSASVGECSFTFQNNMCAYDSSVKECGCHARVTGVSPECAGQEIKSVTMP